MLVYVGYVVESGYGAIAVCMSTNVQKVVDYLDENYANADHWFESQVVTDEILPLEY